MGMVRQFMARCETCGTGEENFYSPYARAVVQQIKLNGWRIRGTEFYCPECRKNIDKRGKKNDAESL